eukprot:CAMPEP_0170548342 /NCGR_PEP_ID=MMETSP0211-20121228/6666_1 /TAXON_ID=311385 /ORGANISM="Pseudokeronopsis sp., Strain OXSARD2" /LENGTH=69 /DNA_ID=CAMNT_0010853841 /DNA_START=1482 /DNA_END=1688 /DNA_ORIENTATION=+
MRTLLKRKLKKPQMKHYMMCPSCKFMQVFAKRENVTERYVVCQTYLCKKVLTSCCGNEIKWGKIVHREE